MFVFKSVLWWRTWYNNIIFAIVQSTVSGLLKDSNPLFQDNDILGKSKFCLLVGKTAIGAKYGNFGVAQFWWSRLYVYKFTEKRVLLIESTGRFE